MKKTRYFAAVFTGNMVFFFLYAGVVWVLTLLNATPYGKFVNTFFRGRTKEDAKAFMEANQVVFDQMLKDASFFANVVLTPSVALVTGLVAGAILYPRRKMAVVWSLVTVIPVSILLLAKSAGEPWRILYFLMLLVAAAIGGFIGSAILSRKKENKDVIA